MSRASWTVLGPSPRSGLRTSPEHAKKLQVKALIKGAAPALILTTKERSSTEELLLTKASAFVKVAPHEVVAESQPRNEQEWHASF